MSFGKRTTATPHKPKKKKGFDRIKFVKSKKHRGWFVKFMTKKL